MSQISSNKMQQEQFKACEYKIFKKFHREVLMDDGIPTLKKREFQMPNSMGKNISTENEDNKEVLSSTTNPNKIF